MYADDYLQSVRSKSFDTDRGSLRKAVELLARMALPNTITAQATQTSAAGATYVRLTSVPCHQVGGSNNTGTSLTFRRFGTTSVLIFADGAKIDLPCVANSAEWEVRRTDVSNTQVTFGGLLYSNV